MKKSKLCKEYCTLATNKWGLIPLCEKQGCFALELEQFKTEDHMDKIELDAIVKNIALEAKIEKLETMLKLADAIIMPACEILPDTYDKEIDAYLKLKTDG